MGQPRTTCGFQSAWFAGLAGATPSGKAPAGTGPSGIGVKKYSDSPQKPPKAELTAPHRVSLSHSLSDLEPL
jgi:hypothetical protein